MSNEAHARAIAEVRARLKRLGQSPRKRRIILMKRIAELSAFVQTEQDHDGFAGPALSRYMVELYILLAMPR